MNIRSDSSNTNSKPDHISWEKKRNIKVVNLTKINIQAIKLNNYHLIIPI